MTLGDYCNVRREGGRIMIEVPEDEMIDYFHRSDPEFPTVGDRDQFIPAMTAQLLQVELPTGDDHFTTCLEELFRRAARSAAMDGNGATLNDEEPLTGDDQPLL